MEIKKSLSYLGIPYTILKTNSPINGEITVVSVFGRDSLSVGNLTQSGPIVEGLWKKAFSYLLHSKTKIKKALVLGLGGGSIISVFKSYFPEANITGVDIDPVMVDLGKKYLGLQTNNISLKIEDAYDFVVKSKEKYDLIIFDILIGRETPKKFLDLEFLKKLRGILIKDGVVIYNRLRLKDQKNDWEFIKNLTVVFPNVSIRKPLVNSLIFCRS